jgi:hypothetical protein
MKKILLVVAALAVAYPAAANAASFKGTVVGKGRASLAVAQRTGAVRTVSTRAHARVGAIVAVRATRLSSGIYRASSIRVVGHATRVHIRAVFVKRLGTWSVVSGGHSLLALRSGARALAAAGQSVQPGAVVDTTAQVNGQTLTQTQMQPVGQTGTVTIQATVLSVAPGSITLQVGTQQVTLSLPAGLTLPNLAGQTVSLQLSFANGNVQAKEDDEDNDDQGDDDDSGDDDNGGGDDG